MSHATKWGKFVMQKQARKIEVRHPKCKGSHDMTPDAGFEFECGYESYLDCGECKYGLGRKDPEAKCNQTEA